MTAMSGWRVCDACAIVVVNGDDSHLSDDMAREVSWSIDLIVGGNIGAITGVAERGASNYARCVLCGYDEICSKVLDVHLVNT